MSDPDFVMKIIAVIVVLWLFKEGIKLVFGLLNAMFGNEFLWIKKRFSFIGQGRQKRQNKRQARDFLRAEKQKSDLNASILREKNRTESRRFRELINSIKIE